MVIINKLLLIYNPVAGEGAFKDNLDRVIYLFQQKGFRVVVHRTYPHDNLDGVIREMCESVDMVVAAGGDGTVNSVVNCMLKSSTKELPLGIIPAGTSNDLINHLKLPSNLNAAVDIIGRREIAYVDVGEVNGGYFVNVVSGGLMMDVPHSTNIKLKNIAGRLAYYLKGLEQLPHIKPAPIHISFPEGRLEDEVLLFIVLNGSIAGGFKNLAPLASMTDGKLDLLVFKPVPISKLVSLFLKILKGEHVKDASLIYLQTPGPITISGGNDVSTDIDGEKGPGLPMEIKVLAGRVPVFVKSKGGLST